MSGLPDDICELLRRHDGVLLTADARRAGITRSRLSRLAFGGQLTRLVHGVYTSADEFAGLDDWQRFAMRARAFALMGAPNSYLTGWAGVVIRGFPTVGRPPKLATVVRPKSAQPWPFTGIGGRVLVAEVPKEHRRCDGRVPIVSDEWAVVEVARTAKLPDSLVVADVAVRRGLDLAGVLPHMHRWEGIGRAAWVVEQSVSTIESPLETLGRFTFIESDLPMPVTNAWVGRDRPEWRLDGLLPWHWWGYEADGALKYDNRDDASQIVRAQHQREFQLRRLGLDLVRFGWPDAYPSREPLAHKVRVMFGDHPARGNPIRWWMDVPGVGPVEPRREDWPSPDPTCVELPAGWRRDLDGLRDDEADEGDRRTAA
jgi:hypothetical protein